MDIDKLIKVTESLLKDTLKDSTESSEQEAQVALNKKKAELFDSTLSMNEDFILEASGGEMDDCTSETKSAVFKVLVDLNEFLLIQDQMEIPN